MSIVEACASHVSMAFPIALLFLSTSLASALRCTDYEKACEYEPVPLRDVTDAIQASQAAYKDTIGVGDMLPGSGYVVTHVIKKTYMDENVKVIIAKKSVTVIVAFRGTIGATQLAEQFLNQLKYPDGVEVVFGETSTRVMRFPWEAFQLLNSELAKIQLLRDVKQRYIVTGHSLGGALASLYAIYIKDKKGAIWSNDGSRLITFASPRVGNSEFAQIHDELLPPVRKLRIVNRDDIIPHLPPFLTGYRHHSRGVWMKDRSEWEVCGKQENLVSCGNIRMVGLVVEMIGKSGLSGLVHLMEHHALKEYIKSLRESTHKISFCTRQIFSKCCDAFDDMKYALQNACNK